MSEWKFYRVYVPNCDYFTYKARNDSEAVTVGKDLAHKRGRAPSFITDDVRAGARLIWQACTDTKEI